MLRNDKSDVRTGFVHDRCERMDYGLGYGTAPVFALHDVSDFVHAPDVYRVDINIHRATRRFHINLYISKQADVSEDMLDPRLEVSPIFR